MACQHPPIPHSTTGRQNWVSQEGGLPEPIDCLARALYWSSGTPTSKDRDKAYEMAVGVAEDFAAGRRKISKEKQAKYVAAIAQWNAMRAAAKARPNK